MNNTYGRLPPSPYGGREIRLAERGERTQEEKGEVVMKKWWRERYIFKKNLKFKWPYLIVSLNQEISLISIHVKHNHMTKNVKLK